MLKHVSVLKNEILKYWFNKKNGLYVDCTFGGGGHSQALLDILDNESQLIGIDQDLFSIEIAKKIASKDCRFKYFHTNFQNMQRIWEKDKIPLIDGILFDLGVSSFQLDDPERGFSFHYDGPLDMRMDQSQTKTAADLVNNLSLSELANCFSKNGDAKYAYQVAKKIVEWRNKKKFVTTFELVNCIKDALPKKTLFEKKHPARIYFQALRILLNNELEAIKNTLKNLEKILNKNAIIIFITFHSLEENIIKQWIRDFATDIDLKGVPIKIKNKYSLIINRPITPSEKEIETNKRARSSKMWILRKN